MLDVVNVNLHLTLGVTMKCQSLLTQCKCGGLVPPIMMWIGENNSLVIEGLCMICGSKVSAQSSFKSLYDIARKLRGDVERKPLVPPINNDKEWLHKLGISES